MPRKSKTTIVRSNQPMLIEAEPSTRLELIKRALSPLDFGFTIFFTSERGERVKYYQGAVIQEDAPKGT